MSKIKKSVDILYFGRVSAKTGVSTVLKSFMKGDVIFKENNILMRVFDLEGEYVEKESNKEGVTSGVKFSSTFRSNLKSFAKKSFFVSWLLVYRFYWHNAKKSLKLYLSRKRTSDVMFFHDFFSCYLYLNLNLNLKQKKILILHSNGDTFKMLIDYYPKLKNTFVHRSLLRKEKFVLSKIDKVGFVSENSSNLFKEIHRSFDAEKVFYVHNGIEDIMEERAVIKDNDRLTLVCAASISERKGQDIIVNAVALLDKKYQKKIKIQLLGVGPLMTELIIFVKKHNLEDVIIFEGQVNNVNNYLLEADGFILTSRDEGLPMCIIEAMRVGLPIIATNIAGVPEQVKNTKNGYLIEPSIDELKNVLELVISDKNLFIGKGKISRDFFKNMFTIERMLNGYSIIINDN